MTEKDFLSMDQMTAMLDNAPVAIFVSADSDRRLLYTNPMARELFPESVRPDIACYTLAGFSEPCPFCPAGKMSKSELKVREYHHPGNHRTYQLSGKFIDWAGQPAHIEYILDITDRKRDEERHRRIEDELQTTLGSIPCGLCVYRFAEGRILPIFHNPAFYEIMGYSSEHIHSVERKTDFLGVHPDDLAILKEKIETVIRDGGLMQDTYRLYNDRRKEYRWINLMGSVMTNKDGEKLLYGVYSDVSEQKRLEKELIAAGEKMQDVVNAIPGGVAVYKVSDIFETMYFSEGVPALTGYTVEEYKELVKQDAAQMIYPEDTAMVVEKVRQAIKTQTVMDFEFRKQHRDGHIVWVHVQAKQIGEDGGCPLFHCVFHDVSALREAQMEMNHLVNSIPGGIASYKIEGDRCTPIFYSDGVPALTGRTREEYERNIHQGVADYIYEPDRERITKAGREAMRSGEVLDVSYRVYRKDGTLGWIHLNGRRMGPVSESMRFYAVFTGMSEQSRLYQNIANETADGIYVIDQENYELLYANESKTLFMAGKPFTGQKCYEAIHGRTTPCEFCTLKKHGPDGKDHEFEMDGTGRFYTARFRETNWNGIPAYIQYIRDVTDEVNTRRDKERLEMYFKTIVEALPGGISVIRIGADGSTHMEYVSSGVADMTHMTMEEVEALYADDICGGLHPEDVPKIREELARYLERGEGHCELNGRMRLGDGGYIWVKSVLSMLCTPDGVRRLYSVYTDISKTVEENEQLRRQYENMILQHYRTPGPDTLIVGHCNITQNRILEIKDYTDSRLLETLGRNREEFFTGIAGLVVDEAQRQMFLDTYLNAPALAAFARKDTEQILKCLIRLPGDGRECYVQFKVNLVETPDTGDITGILTVTDITEQTISERILHELSVSSHDYIVDLNLKNDFFRILSNGENTHLIPESQGCYSKRLTGMVQSVVVPRDRERYEQALSLEGIRRQLNEKNSYTIAYSVIDEKGDIRTKNMTVFAADLRLGRVCLACTDITDSVREQQGLLNMIAYTFDLAGFIHTGSGHFTMYTRQMVLENLPPYQTQDYDHATQQFVGCYGTQEDTEDVEKQFLLETILQRLAEKPAGYDFVFPYHAKDGSLLYKQINVLWGDQNHGTVCIVRADVTDMLAAERSAKKALEEALTAAEQASRAKSEFLTSMSHDIRTPMNAIMGMTTLALAYLDDRERVQSCLQKISAANKHLLSLINDVLDMSRIERSKIVMSQRPLSLPDLIAQLSAIIEPQARDAGLRFEMREKDIAHEYFYGDSLRINQVLINLLSNAVKFTPEGGRVTFEAEEIPPVEKVQHVRYRFTIRDTGIGMSGEFQNHIFEPFAREDTILRIEGTGLGLSITKGLVELMQGEISVDSRLNEGSTFQVELEFEQVEHTEGICEKGAGNAGFVKDKPFAGYTFLIAEDHPINAELLSALLSMSGAESVVRTDGAQALQAVETAPPGTYDAVLMDIQMPNMTGYEATRAIRALDRPDAKTIPIVAMTANAFAEDVQACLDAGMNAHVAKPIDVDVLRTTLGRVLGL